MSGHTPLRMNAGDETRVMADDMPLFDIKCGGMSGRTVADGERIAADIVARYNAAVADVVAALEDIAAPVYVPVDQLPQYGQPNGWRAAIFSSIRARTALARIRGEG